MKTYNRSFFTTIVLAGAIAFCSLNLNAAAATTVLPNQSKMAADTGKMKKDKMQMKKKKMAKMKKEKMKMAIDTASKM